MSDAPLQTEGARISKEVEQMHLARGYAINRFAELEMALSNALAYFANMDLTTAYTVFYKLGTTSARLSLMEEFFERRYGKNHAAFWQAIAKDVRLLNDERNKIVHWPIGVLVAGQPVKLSPGNIIQRIGGNKKAIELSDVWLFGEKTSLLTGYIMNWCTVQFEPSRYSQEEQVSCWKPWSYKPLQ